MSSHARQNVYDGLFACKQGVFWIEPYLQLGDDGTGKSFEIVWFSPFSKKYWRAERRRSPKHCWVNLDIERVSVVSLPSPESRDAGSKHGGNQLASTEFKQLVATLPVEVGWDEQEYRLLVNGCEVFASRYLAPSNRIAVFGDFADGRKGAADTARTILKFDPSLLVIPGDIVYDHGRLSEYHRYFFPAVNGVATADGDDTPQIVLDHEQFIAVGEKRRTAKTDDWRGNDPAAVGAPLLRSRASVAALGNHDIGLVKTASMTPINLNCGKTAKTVEFDPGRYDDLFAYFHIFRQPANGPVVPFRLVKPGIVNDPRANKLRLRFGDDFLRKTNFAFDWLNTHWTVLDANRYMDWSIQQLRAWLRADLRKAKKADWKFLVYHQPPFNSDVKYWNEQRMRLIFDILQEEKVDMTFSGHCHYYERHRPLRFRATAKKPADDGTVDGALLIDQQYDGVTNCRPQGVINLITGCGGQTVSEMHKRGITDYSKSTCKVIDDKRSFTLLDVDGKRLTVRQVTDAGDEIDKFVIDKR